MLDSAPSTAGTTGGKRFLVLGGRWPLIPMAGDEHFNALAAARLGFESFGAVEFAIRPIKKIPIRLALKNLHDHISARSKQYPRPGQQFMA